MHENETLRAARKTQIICVSKSGKKVLRNLHVNLVCLRAADLRECEAVE